MAQEKSAIIIGAGIGGIATSIFLAKKGFSVNVYEKNAFPGGRCGQIIREGHRFDTGATIFLMPSIYRQVFNSLGLNLDESLETVPLSTLYHIFYPDNKVIEFTPDKNKLKEQVEAFEQGSFIKAEKYINRGYGFFQLALKKLLDKNFYRLSEFITLDNALLLLKLRAFTNHKRYTRRYFKNQHLQIAFTFQNIYVGQNPEKAPALFSMLPAAELTEGSLFPVGGMHSIAKKLLSLAERLGVCFNYNQPVTGIITGDHKAEGVKLSNGAVVNADVIIANADLPYVYSELLPDSLQSKHINNLKHTCSAIVFHWGLDKIYPQLGHHNVFLSGEYKLSLDKIFKKHSLSDNPSFYIHAPVRSDKTAAPSGEDTISVIIPSGYFERENNINWELVKVSAREAVIRRLKKAGLDDIEKHIKFEICFLPQTWHDTFNLSKGATFGSLSHHIFQMGYFRPHNRHKRYHNLYFAGGSTHPGNGVPLVLLSAKLTSERIEKEIL